MSENYTDRRDLSAQCSVQDEEIRALRRRVKDLEENQRASVKALQVLTLGLIDAADLPRDIRFARMQTAQKTIQTIAKYLKVDECHARVKPVGHEGASREE